MTVPVEEINFRKRINKINTLRSILRQKKQSLAKLSQHADCTEECLQLQNEINKLENEIKLITNLQ